MRLALAFLIGGVIGCSPAAGNPTAAPGTPTASTIGPASTPSTSAQAMPTGPAPTTAPPMLPAAEWRTAALRDVIAATDFRIDDLVGKVVAIEPMAIWCVNCRAQQHEALAALAILSSPDVVYVSLDVDPNERAEDLALYAQEQGFNWRFAVAPTGVSRSLADTFGNQILSPPSTPLVVLSRDGTVVESSFGFRTTDQLVALLGEQLQ